MQQTVTPIRWGLTLVITALFLALFSVSKVAKAEATISNSYDGTLDEKKALQLSQDAIGRKVRDFSFRDTNGKRVHLSDFEGKPIVISLIYSSCADVCPVITSTLKDVAEMARDAVGEDSFTILTIGFDIGEDNPARMKSFARQYGVEVSEHWKFLSGDLTAIAGLSDDLGFQFFESAKGFDHLTQTTILDRNRVVYRQIYGETFEAPHFVDPIIDLNFGTETPFASIGDLINKVRLFCTIYDPTADRYRFEYAMFFRYVVGGSIILSMIVYLLNWVRQNNKRKQQSPHIKNEMT